MVATCRGVLITRTWWAARPFANVRANKIFQALADQKKKNVYAIISQKRNEQKGLVDLDSKGDNEFSKCKLTFEPYTLFVSWCSGLVLRRTCNAQIWSCHFSFKKDTPSIRLDIIPAPFSVVCWPSTNCNDYFCGSSLVLEEDVRVLQDREWPEKTMRCRFLSVLFWHFWLFFAHLTPGTTSSKKSSWTTTTKHGICGVRSSIGSLKFEIWGLR